MVCDSRLPGRERAAVGIQLAAEAVERPKLALAGEGGPVVAVDSPVPLWAHSGEPQKTEEEVAGRCGP